MQAPTSAKATSARRSDMDHSICRGWTHKTVKEGDVN